jgi:putative transposase
MFEAVEFRQRTLRWFAHLVLLMPDHLHALVAFPVEEEMKRVVANFKELTAKWAGVEWQPNFFDHRLRSDESFAEKAHYIRMNPVRGGLVTRAEEWAYIWEMNNNSDMQAQAAARPAVAPYL